MLRLERGKDRKVLPIATGFRGMIEAISAEEKRHKMLLPLVGVPCLIQEGLEPYRDLFCRKAGFEWVSRYVTGLLLRNCHEITISF